MRKHLILSIIFVFLLASGQTFAQKGKIKKANNFLKALDYQSAIDILIPLTEDEGNAEILTLLGDIFRIQNSNSRAAFWYAKAVAVPEVEASAFFYYGLTLLYTGQCREAQQQFDYFKSLRPLDPRLAQLKDACSYRKELLRKHLDSLEVEVLKFNSVFNDIGPAFYAGGLVFGSVRTQKQNHSSKPGNPFYDLYYAELDSEHSTFSFGQPVSFSARLNSRVHEAIVTFNQDGSKIYFTRNQGKDNEHSSATATGLEIVYATSDDGEHWEELQSLPFNSSKYSIAHPSLSPDSKQLYFSSDMPGGLGGKDIYVSHWEADHWADPVNLGPMVNTEGDEMFPYFHPNGKLFFSSNGQIGLGGLDIFSTEQNQAGIWDNIQNVGAPINSESDDYGIIISQDQSYGFFTSNRPGGIGKDDIYGFRKLQTKKKSPAQTAEAGIDNPKITTYRPGSPDEEAGEVNPVETDIALQAPQAKATDTIELAADPELQDLKPSTTEAPAEEMVTKSGSDLVKKRTDPEIDQKSMDLIPQDIKTAKTTKYLIGTVYDPLNKRPIPFATIHLLNTTCGVNIKIQSDDGGYYRLPLIPDCCINIRVEKEGFQAYTALEAICADEDGNVQGTTSIMLKPAQEPIPVPVQNEVADKPKAIAFEGFERSKNSKAEDAGLTFVLNVYYETARTSVKKGSVEDLKKLLRLLEENSTLIVEIGAHTDSRGSKTYNLNLSQRRAENVVRYLVSQGIDEDRLIAKGYGETQLINECEDDKECSDEEHQINRRTEFKIIGKIENTE